MGLQEENCMLILPIWMNRDKALSSSVFGGKQSYDYWKLVFETGKTPQGMSLLLNGLELKGILAS